MKGPVEKREEKPENRRECGKIRTEPGEKALGRAKEKGREAVGASGCSSAEAEAAVSGIWRHPDFQEQPLQQS